MDSGSSSDFGYVVTMLANRLKTESLKEEEGKSFRASVPDGKKIVFLLGAGCSKQYGLPSFWELLSYFWHDCYHERPDSSWGFEILRDRLDKYWRALGPEARKKALDRYLRHIDGGNCPAYLRLADLASSGYVKAIINMNFDTLLEEALDAEGVPYRVSTSFQSASDSHLMIYKPHGSIGPIPADEKDPSRANDLILDIANSDLFANPEEQKSAQDLLTGHDVVAIGYSGVDAKIVAALRAFTGKSKMKEKKLFVINITRPDPRLLLVMAERASEDLLVVGEDGSFENFMEFLERAVKEPIVDFDDLVVPPIGNGFTFMTRSERIALADCLRLALSIRAGINVADRSSKTIEAHAQEIYELCLKLANAAGDCLTPPEKFLLYAAALLHDLGYFAAYSGGNALSHPGWKLLNEHGQKTKALIEERLNTDKSIHIVPVTYDNHKGLRETLLDICANHSTWMTKLVTPLAQDPQSVRVSGRAVQVRPGLLRTLFAAAEELAMEHPFLPSPDPVVAGQKNRVVVEDPVLDLFLRRKKDEVVFDIERGKVIGRTRDGYSSKTALWLLNDASRYIELYAEHSKGWKWEGGEPQKIAFTCDPARRLLGTKDPKKWEVEVVGLLAEALEDGLSESLRRVQVDVHKEVADLLADAGKELAAAFPQMNGGLVIVVKLIDSVRRSLSREWIFDLYLSGRDVESLLKGLAREHGRIFRSAQQKISESDAQIRKLLRDNISELARTRVWFRLATIDGILKEIGRRSELIELSLIDWSDLLKALEENIAFLNENRDVYSRQEKLEDLAAQLTSLSGMAKGVNLRCLVDKLSGGAKAVKGRVADSAAYTQVGATIFSAVVYLTRMEVSRDIIIPALVKVGRAIESQGASIEDKILDDLAHCIDGLEALAEAEDKGVRLGPKEISELAEHCRGYVDSLRRKIDGLVVEEAIQSLGHIGDFLDSLTEEERMQLKGMRSLLGKAMSNLENPAPSYVTSVLDLLAIYTMGGEGNRLEPRGEPSDEEPSVSFKSKPVAWALDWIERAEKNPRNSVLDFYFRFRGGNADAQGALEAEFKMCFEDILFPAWRFFGRNLHDGIESILMAVICFDLGSSRFRDEAVSGIRHLLVDGVISRSGAWAYGHDQCTLCTSRLLYILSHARRLFPPEELDGLKVAGAGVDETVKGLLKFFLDRDPEAEAWWGLGCNTDGSKILSADYLAWAARSVLFCLTVDRELLERTGKSWLGQKEMFGRDYDKVVQLLKQRWAAVLGIDDRLLGEDAEEPHSLILGNVAITCLDFLRYGNQIPGFEIDGEGKLSKLSAKLAEGKKGIGILSKLSKFFVWPVLLLQDRLGNAPEKDPALEAVKTCRACVRSPIWIKAGLDAGSWGFNVKNTQAVISPLVEFWRYVLEDEARRKSFEAIFEQEADSPSPPRPLGRSGRKAPSRSRR